MDNFTIDEIKSRYSGNVLLFTVNPHADSKDELMYMGSGSTDEMIKWLINYESSRKEEDPDTTLIYQRDEDVIVVTSTNQFYTYTTVFKILHQTGFVFKNEANGSFIGTANDTTIGCWYKSRFIHN